MLYKGIELKCTETELNDFIASIETSCEVRDFSQKYNNVNIQNPTSNENAKYYVLIIAGTTHLQAHSPFEQGFVAITDENSLEVIENHKQQIIDNMIFSKFAVTEEDKTNNKIAELELALAELSMLMATAQ